MTIRERVGRLMKMRISARNIFLLLAALLIAGPSFTLLKYFTISTKTLSNPNPTSYVFHVNAEELLGTIWRSYCYYCPRDPHPACHSDEGLTMDSPVKVMMEPGYWRKSETYFWLGTPLDYHADYMVRVTARGDSMTEVQVETTNATVIIGPSFGMHGGNLNHWVAPTSVEEYRFLETIGCVLGEEGMPPLNLPK